MGHAEGKHSGARHHPQARETMAPSVLAVSDEFRAQAAASARRQAPPPSAAGTGVAKSDGPYLASCYGLSLPRLEVLALEAAVEVGPPLKGALREAPVERVSHRRVPVEAFVFGTPLREHGLDRRVATLSRVPSGSRPIQAIPAKLLDQEGAVHLERVGHPINCAGEVLHVVERVARHRRVERPSVIKVLERGTAEDWPLRSLGVDCEDAIPRGVHCSRQTPGSAANLKHPRWGWRKGSEDEGSEIQDFGWMRPIKRRHSELPIR
jgi:hypothetical protein